MLQAIAALLQDILRAITQIDQLVDEAVAKKIHGRLACQVEVERHFGIDTDTEIVVETN